MARCFWGSMVMVYPGKGIVKITTLLLGGSVLQEEGARLHDFDAVFADYSEHVEEVGEAEKGANLLAQIDKFKAGAGGHGCDAETHQGSEAHAVGVLQIGETEDNAAVIRKEGTNLGEEDIGSAGDEPAVAADEGYLVRTAFDIDRKHGDGDNGRHGIGHEKSSIETWGEPERF